MRTIRLAVLALIGVFALGLHALPAFAEPLAMPGYTWGSATYIPFGSPGLTDRGNAILDMKVEQGIDWFRFNHERTTFNTFVDMRFNLDSAGDKWNNYVSPGVGVKLRTVIGNTAVDVGVRAFEQAYWRGGHSGVGGMVFVTWWSNWDLYPLIKGKEK